jgi:L-lactate dehydrogenase complex protein LldG
MTEFLRSRQVILNRIRAAIRPSADNLVLLAGEYAVLPRTYIRTGHLSAAARIELMIERLREYDAEVVESTPDTLPAVIAAQLLASGKQTFVAPPGLHSEWLVPGFDWRIDHDLTNAEIEEAEGVLTSAFCGVADSGTIILHHSATEGRRVLTLLPDWHLCILRASQIVETFPEYFDRCQEFQELPALGLGDKDLSLGSPAHHPSDEYLSLGTPALVTTISGPSATADIEMTRIKGVHGPRFLHVVIVRDQGATPLVH